MAAQQPAQILSPEKLAEARRTGELRVNIGCGHIALDGYVNVDKRNLPGVDIVADAGGLPFEPQSVVEIFSTHVLEHFPEEQLRRALLPHWYSLLAPQGIFRAIVPDGEAMLAHSAAGEYPFDDFREVLYGAQEYDGDYHYNLFTPASLAKLLNEAGFHNIEIPVHGRRNGKCYEFEIKAQRKTPIAASADNSDSRQDTPRVSRHLHRQSRPEVLKTPYAACVCWIIGPWKSVSCTDRRRMEAMNC